MDAVQNPAAGSLSRSRIVPPQVPAEYSLRPAIRNLLDRNPHSRVLMFSAPAGFGKTCALAALARERTVADQAVAWLSLAEEDDDPARFCRQLIEALGEAVPQLGDDAQTYLQNTMRVPVVAVIESLLGDLDRYARPLLLVLDDLHLVSNPDIFTGLNRLVQYAPPGLVLALGTRSQPALSLATWRAKGLLLEIGLEELRLGFEETREYLERSGLYLDEPCLKALYGQTEGWVVGVHLVSLWLRQQPQAQEMALLDGDKQAVSAYLLAAVFERLPGDLQEALLALGVASQLSGDLANALTGRQDGQALLERLESMQLFLLPLDRERQWYRFHLLFADFLRNRLRDSDPDRFKQLHFNASLWFTNHHMPTFAIEHACAAEDPEMIAALVDGCGLELINRGQLSLIYRWRKHVPDEIAERYPILVLTDVWSRASDLSLGEANRIIDELLARWGESRVRLLQGRGHFSEALHEITQLRGTLQPGWHGLQRLRLDILAALSYQRLGYQERANSLLGECLINAEREGVRSLFIEEGDGIRQLLQQLESTERQPALQTFIRGLLGIWPGQGVRKPQDALEEGLTEREREVVCLAAQGLSNEEIGQRLSLALGTVKWHLHNIYEKLKVRNRTQAIRRARELSLL
ncbi:LuxR C-terminal-related transcriptional regulator [Pseudomonas aeruginosa]|uniref:LuxR C-terminal-related transcriptional regulator n=1 Tax=Pseudomonas aeruginosa TaxID=287 RepID=UPI003CC6D1EF